MGLYLVQHGISLPKDVDPGKGLSEEGISDVKRIAEVAKGYHVQVSQIRHSGKKRTRQTAKIFAAALNPLKGIQEVSGLNPLDDVTKIARTVGQPDDTMWVGHLPFMERMTAFLITGATDIPVFKFQNGGILCLNQDPVARSWVIKWSLMPYIG
jgi:phosphohistidine phosphatase